MKNTIKKQLTAVIVVAAMSLAMVACGNKAANVVEDTAEVATEAVQQEAEAVVEEVAEAVEETATEVAEEVVEETAEEPSEAEVAATEVGEGATQFTFEVVDGDGNTTLFLVNTDKKTVGEALVDNALVEGEESEYGLYVKTVNGIVADYDVDQTYWAFYIDGEYAMTGVDATDIVAGSTYSFKVEK